jgi:hypothetical protein
VYRMKLDGTVDYVMPYCPWCGARLRGAGSVVKRWYEKHGGKL